VVGVASPEPLPADDLRRYDSLFSRLDQPIAEDTDPKPLDPNHPAEPTATSSSATNGLSRKASAKSTVASHLPQDKGIRSTVKVLKSILKKPRRWSVEVENAKIDKDAPTIPLDEPNIDSATIAQQTEPSPPPNHNLVSDIHSTENVTAQAVGINGRDLKSSPQALPRSSLQLAPFDRKLFAIRGAELRNEYMRDNPASNRDSYN
jgi:hypothetical protein